MKAPRATISIDGATADWKGLPADSLTMDTAGRGDLRVELRYAWDEDYFYVLLKELPGDTTQKEPGSIDQFLKEVWSYDGMSLFLDMTNRNVLEDVKDFNPWFAFTSEPSSEFYAARTYRSLNPKQERMDDSLVAAAGSFADNSRVVEAAIAWKDIAESVESDRLPGGGLLDSISPGYRFGCDPLLLDDGYRAQAFVSGKVQDIPAGYEKSSIDILLTARPTEGED